tara:strand:+ start:689 stop:853 length:165 start_codon:yes stop_codon:yes gene_type:complete
MRITIGTPEILIICGTALGALGNPTALSVLLSIGCISAVFRFASDHQENKQTED